MYKTALAGGHRETPFDGEPPRHDRLEPDRLRSQAGELPTLLFHPGGRLQLRPWCRSLEIVDAAGSQLGGYSATEAYLPSQKVSVSVVTTFNPGAFDSNGVYGNTSDTVFRLVGANVAPSDAPPADKKPLPTGCSSPACCDRNQSSALTSGLCGGPGQGSNLPPDPKSFDTASHKGISAAWMLGKLAGRGVRDPGGRPVRHRLGPPHRTAAVLPRHSATPRLFRRPIAHRAPRRRMGCGDVTRVRGDG
jgi:hypothetical protein